MSTIIEVATDPEQEWVVGSVLTTGDPGRWETRWKEKMAIDIRWIAGARPWQSQGVTGTAITFAGSGRWDHVIRMAYPDFMAAWMSAKA